MSRDRDAQGRPRNARARDALGRPLPRGEAGHPPEDAPALPPAQALAAAAHDIDAGLPFRAHEVLEAVWKTTEGPERDLWRGLAQVAVALTHHRRGNARGATALFDRAAHTLEPWAGRTPHGVPVDALRAWCLHAAANGPAERMPALTGPQAADDRDAAASARLSR